MPWFNVDDGFAFHRKTVRAGNAAAGLWVRAGSWCAKELTDGFVPDHMVPTMGTAKQAERLVEAGLWVRDDVRGGFQFHQYADDGRNFTREVVLKKREQAAEKKRKQREGNGQKSDKPQVGESRPEGTSGGVPEGVPGGVNVPPPLPSPPSSPNGEEPSLRSGSRAKRSTTTDRATTVPLDFSVTPEMVEWARHETPLVEGRRATEAFVDHWRQATKNHRKRDWAAAWRNWMRKAQDDAEARQARTPRTVGGQRSTTSERVSGWDEFLSPEARPTGTDGLALVYSAPEPRALPRGAGQ
jgi:hypothetical protein